MPFSVLIWVMPVTPAIARTSMHFKARLIKQSVLMEFRIAEKRNLTSLIPVYMATDKLQTYMSCKYISTAETHHSPLVFFRSFIYTSVPDFLVIRHRNFAYIQLPIPDKTQTCETMWNVVYTMIERQHLNCSMSLWYTE